MHRFDQARAAFEGFSRLRRGVPAFFTIIVAGHALGRELSGEGVYWPTVTFEALFYPCTMGLGVPFFAISLALLVYTEVSRLKILYSAMAISTTLGWIFYEKDWRQIMFALGVCGALFLGAPVVLSRFYGNRRTRTDEPNA